MTQKTTSITEIPNSITSELDLASACEMTRLFRQVDAQLFNGYLRFESMLDKPFLDRFENAVNSLTEIFSSGQSVKVVLTGAGTSGRLGAFVAKTFNKILADKELKPVFDYFIAGGNKALVKAQEGAEDDPIQAVKDLKSFEEDGVDRMVFIGVTCGFSAPYTAGQMIYTLDNPKYYSVLVGFNPVERGRNVHVENWDHTFLSAVKLFEKGRNTAIINPVVGPEGLTGSTRLKGGSATKILCESLLYISLLNSGMIEAQEWGFDEYPFEASIPDQIRFVFQLFEQTRISLYQKNEQISELMEIGGQVLKDGGHIYYLGVENLGNLATIDASECPPTFGSKFEDVRGFIHQGWKGLLNKDIDLSHVDWMYQIDVEHFFDKVADGLTDKDVVFVLGEQAQTNLTNEWIAKLSESYNAKVVPIYFSPETLPDTGKTYQFDLPVQGLAVKHCCFNEFAMKLVLNLITTAAHVIKGKVFRNRMIDLNISNNKLFYRTIGIIESLLGVDMETARQATIGSIYHVDEPTEEMLNAPISEYVDNANGKDKVVPRAILMATGKFTYAQAVDALSKEPIVRNIIESYVV